MNEVDNMLVKQFLLRVRQEGYSIVENPPRSMGSEINMDISTAIIMRTLIASTNSHIRKDGSKYEVRKQRYICCNKARHRGECDGQSAYVSDRIDGAVNTVVLEYLSRIKATAKSIALEKRYENEIAKSLNGDSAFTPDMLAMAIDSTKLELQNTEDKLAQLNYALTNSQGAMKKLDFYYEQFLSA